MEIRKKIFPQSKAPEIARKKVMQYIYWYSQKSVLSKKIYFNNIYAPVFVLLIICIWFLFMYPRQIRQENPLTYDSNSIKETANETNTLSLESNIALPQNSPNNQQNNTNQTTPTDEKISYRQIDSSTIQDPIQIEKESESDQNILSENNDSAIFKQETEQYNKSPKWDALMFTMIADDTNYSQTQQKSLEQSDQTNDIEIIINSMLDIITDEENISPNDLSLSNENKIYQLDNLQSLLIKNTETSDSIFYNNEKIKLYEDQLSSLNAALQNIKNSSDKWKNPSKSEIKYYNNILKDVLILIKSEIFKIKNLEHNK